MSGESTLESLLLALESPEVGERWAAAGELVQYEGAAVALITLYERTDWTVRHIILWTLGEMHCERSLSLIVNALSDPQVHVRLSAARALEKFDHEVAETALETWKSNQVT